MALGSLHEKYEASCPSFLVNQEANSAQQFALMQCNKAISHLSKRLRMNEEDSMEIALIACVLFITFEQLQGNYESALRHWQQGKKVLHGWQEAKNNYQSSSSNALIPLCNPDVIEDNLIRFFGRLDVQAITFIDTRSLQCDETWQSKKPGLGPPHIPDKISSLSEARHYLDEQLEWMFYAAARAIFRLDAWPGDGENTNNVAGLHGYDGLDRWAARFDAFLKHSGSALSARDIRGATLLKILHKVASIMLLSTGLEGFVADETCFDKFSIEFVDILSLAASLINAEISDGVTEAKQARPSFSFDMGVVPPLYYIAVKCREPSIRRQALSLLLASPRREGVWDGLMAARITERLIAIEEEGLESITDCASIPGSARITLVNASMYSDQRRAFLEYTQPRYSTDGNLDTREMWVSW
ncbi:hypothetical protein MMC12_007945 [Toensbergia leucococca]|nr:hypothetical protein [Toensbergia leucococca]